MYLGKLLQRAVREIEAMLLVYEVDASKDDVVAIGLDEVHRVWERVVLGFELGVGVCSDKGV